MKTEVALARAFGTNNPSEWASLPREAINRMLLVLLIWSRRADNGLSVAVPPMIGRRYPGLISTFRISMTDLLLWAMCGVMTEEEVSALSRA